MNEGSRSRVDVTRGGTVESVHLLSGAVVGATGEVVASFGSPDVPTFFRSSAKPFQALPLVEDGVVEAFALTDEELAICCASHSGEARHIALVSGLLERGGLTSDDLACGPQAPFHRPAADALAHVGERPGRIHNNCSGKHVGMLLLARHHGWDTSGYQRADHPVQRRMFDEVARWSSVDRSKLLTAVDGCGVVCFALTLVAMARAYARFLHAASSGEGPAAIVRAMTTHPFAVAGTGRLCTDIMQACQGRVLAKVGAEGVYGGGLVDSGVGFSLKVDDGGWRAAEVGMIALLAGLGAIDEAVEGRLLETYGPVKNTRDEVVGSKRAVLRLDHARAIPIAP